MPARLCGDGMRNISILMAALLLLPGAAHAQDAGASRKALTKLLARTIDAARAMAEGSEAEKRLDDFDKEALQGQFTLILIRAGQCDEAYVFAEHHPRMKAMTISRVMSAAVSSERACALRLAPLMLARWDDAAYVPLGRIGARFRAAAYMDGAGDPAAWALLTAADAEMQQSPDATGRWAIRFDALDAYPDDPQRTHFFEFIVERMLAEPALGNDSARRGFLAAFAFHGRCDLVARATRGGNCVQAEKDVAASRDPKLAEQLATMAKALGAETPVPEQASLDAALAERSPWWRMTRLLQLVESCRKALAVPG